MTFTDIDQTATRDGFTLTATIEPDHSHGAPWDSEDGHGPVSDWTTRDKEPGELVLSESRGRTRFYDYAEACRIARRDGWGLRPPGLTYGRDNGETLAGWSKWDGGEYRDEINFNGAINAAYDAYRATMTARQYAAAAARADFERLRGWCNDQWSYVGVIVTASRNGIELGHASLWGIESDAGDYLLETANELADDAIADAREAIAALGQPDSTLAMR